MPPVRRKKTPEQAELLLNAEAPEPVAETPGEPKRAPRKPGRAQARKAEAESVPAKSPAKAPTKAAAKARAKTRATAPAKAPATAAAEAETKAPPKRRARKAQVAETEAPVAESAAPPPEEAPVRRPRRTRREAADGLPPEAGNGQGSGNGDGQEPPEEGPVIQDQPLSAYVEQAYKRYAIDTILDRALPDVRDGLKPVQRRILWTMHEMHLRHDGPTRKSARVVGDCMGKYHPHGDSSVYDAMVRMAQDFAMLHPLVDGQGNFGSADGDTQAAMRYTEARLSAIGEMMLADIDKNTVDFKDNFDGSEREPTVLPTRFPNLLVNGSAGIAVGMSTSILPHNLGEICDAVTHLAKRWDKRERVTAKELMKIVPGPDLPTGGILYRYRVQGTDSVDMVLEGYETGNTTLVCQARADIQDIGGGKSEIVVTELPYQVQKNTILERVAADRDRFPGITDVRDESDYHGMRVVFEVARGADPREALDALFTYTQMRASLSYNAMALVRVDGVPQPRALSLRDMLEEFVHHRLDVIVRRSRNDLERARARLHIVEGLLKALDAIDEVIAIIRRSRTTETAQTNLMRKLSITEIQATAILDMPLKRLAALERQKLADEAKELRALIADLEEILASEARRLGLVVEETEAIKKQFARPRRSVIVDAEEGHEATLTVADLVVPGEAQRLLLSAEGVDRQDAGVKRRGRRGGAQVLCDTVVPPDATVFLATNRGRLWLDAVGRLPEQATPSSMGLGGGEYIVSCGALGAEGALVFVTRQGNVKRMTAADVRAAGSANWTPLIGLAEEDELLAAGTATERTAVLLCTAGNAKEPARALQFAAETVNTQSSPSARGVAAIKMVEGDPLVAALLIEPAEDLWVVAATTAGHAKRMALGEFPLQGRAGKGVQLWKATRASGPVAAVAVARAGERVDVLLAEGAPIGVALEEVAEAPRAGRGAPLRAAPKGQPLAVTGIAVRPA